jgi:hypothetical protein
MAYGSTSPSYELTRITGITDTARSVSNGDIEITPIESLKVGAILSQYRIKNVSLLCFPYNLSGSLRYNGSMASPLAKSEQSNSPILHIISAMSSPAKSSLQIGGEIH